jgi:hypothetical protein
VKLISQNPYAVIGLLAGEGARAVSKQKAAINAFLRVGKELVFDSDIVLGNRPSRTAQDIEAAYAAIDIDQGKLHHALFWFVKGDHIDEAAIGCLKQGDLDKALDFWTKATDGKSINERNCFSFNNLSTLLLALSASKANVNTGELQKGIRLKAELITSTVFPTFSAAVTDQTYALDAGAELERVVSALRDELRSNQYAGVGDVDALLLNAHPSIQSLLGESISEDLISDTERWIEKIRKERKENPLKAYFRAWTLVYECRDSTKKLATILGNGHARHRMISDALANEILQCGIDYYNALHEEPELHSDYAGSKAGDFGEDILKLFKMAKSIAVGDMVRDRIDENIEGIQDWIDGSEEREKQKKVADDIEFIVDALKAIKQKSATISTVERFISDCKPKLAKIRAVLGKDEEFYLSMSSAVVHAAQDILVNIVNNAQNSIVSPSVQIPALRETIAKCLQIMENMKEVDMVSQLRSQFNKNLATLNDIQGNLRGASTPPNTSEADFTWLWWVAGIAFLLFILSQC